MSFDATREQAALQVQRNRKLTVQQLRDGSYQCFDDRGRAVHLDAQSDPVLALERAEAALAAGDQRDALSRATRLFNALARAQYGLLPKQVTLGDGTTATAWILIDPATKQQVAGEQPQPGLLAALVRIAQLVGEPTS